MITNDAARTGESDLLTLIANMSPSLDSQIWAFVCVDEVTNEFVAERALATFHETEGTTLIVPWEKAKEFERSSEPMARITLNIHSSLEAVGLTAAVSQALASEAISANIVAGFFHDHIFVPRAAGERAVACLTMFSAAAEGF
jgi:hypothetical protein